MLADNHDGAAAAQHPAAVAGLGEDTLLGGGHVGGGGRGTIGILISLVCRL